MRTKGTVHLVGAGPGDPELLTVRALRLIRSARIVAFDELVSSEILALAPPDAEMLAVGRRHGIGPTSYRLHPDVRARALAGRDVVRLKAGDPMVFGRGGEEVEDLRAAGIPYAIVPGITAALGAAAAAEVPLTHRDHASDVLFATGHDVDGSHAERTAWDRVAAGAGTLVLYMAATKLDANMRRLLAVGRPASTPAAWIARASRRDQEIIVGTVGDLASRVGPRAAPAVVIVGEVVRLAARPGAAGAGTSLGAPRGRQISSSVT